MVILVSEIVALMLLRGAVFLSVFDKRQLDAMAMLFLDLHRYRYAVGWILSLWLFPFGVLVFRSGFLPRILGVLLIAASFGYLADSLTPVASAQLREYREPIREIALTMGEAAIILWLWIRGAKDQPLEAAA